MAKSVASRAPDRQKIKRTAECAGRDGGLCPNADTRILLYSPSRSRDQDFRKALRQDPRCAAHGTCAYSHEVDSRKICLTTATRPQEILDALSQHYFNLLLLDLRWSPGQRPGRDQILAEAQGLLDTLDRAEDLETRYGFHRILILVDDRDPDRCDRLMVDFGKQGVGGVLRQRTASGSQGKRSATPDDGFAGKALEQALRLTAKRGSGTRALCAAGGGITGIHFELGALKCLDDCLSGNAINTFDMYFGISAGAVVTGILTAGFSIDEFMAAVVGHEGGRLPHMDLSIMRARNVNFRGYLRRLSRRYQATSRKLFEAIRNPLKGGLDAIAFQYGDLLGPPFHSDAYGEMFKEILSMPGVTNDFRKLKRALYIGASDQDARRHVLFGPGEFEDVPISKAIQASLSCNPVFSSVPIGDRYYEDGAVTRTSNFTEAIRKGAKLVFVLDPFLPYVSKNPGFSAQRGMLYNLDQNLRTVCFTRFENARKWILRNHPEVSSYTFLPSNSIRWETSVNPMDHRPFMKIWKGAYISTLHRIKGIQHRLQGDLSTHGIDLDLDRAEAVADQLINSVATHLSDFYPDHLIELKQPPLCLERADPRIGAS